MKKVLITKYHILKKKSCIDFCLLNVSIILYVGLISLYLDFVTLYLSLKFFIFGTHMFILLFNSLSFTLHLNDLYYMFDRISNQ